MSVATTSSFDRINEHLQTKGKRARLKSRLLKKDLEKIDWLMRVANAQGLPVQLSTYTKTLIRLEAQCP